LNKYITKKQCKKGTIRIEERSMLSEIILEVLVLQIKKTSIIEWSIPYLILELFLCSTIVSSGFLGLPSCLDTCTLFLSCTLHFLEKGP